MNRIKLPKQSRLQEIFNYDAKSGFLYRKINTSSRGRIGKCGHLDKSQGYHNVYVDSTRYKTHRIIWKLYYGEFDENLEIDHINGNRSDNRIVNLQAKTLQENQKNRKISINNKSGVIGVSYNKRQKVWQARIGHNNKDIHLGFYLKKKDAVKARKEAEILYGYHQNHGRKK